MQSAGDNAIEVSKLVKKFGKFTALDGLNLTVRRGEVHGFLGPNGAGKSTTIRILLGILRKTSGSVSLLGGDPWQDAVELHKRLAYVPGEVNLWPNLTGGEAIDLFGALRGGLDKKRKAKLLERFELDPTKKTVRIPKATVKKSRSSLRSRLTLNCTSWTNRHPAWTRSWKQSSKSASRNSGAKAKPCS